MSARPKILKVRRIHGPGESKYVDISFCNERLHASGVFSNVYSAILKSPEVLPIAIKKCWPRNTVSKKTYTDLKILKDLEDTNNGKSEIELLTKVKHPHIVGLLYSLSVEVDSEICNWMILEFLPSDLGKILKNRKLDTLDVKLYSWQLFSALDYISARTVVHRDVKPSNLLVDENRGILKLADFGNAKILIPTEKYPPYQVTRYYRAPELVFGSQRYSTKIDLWSGACVLGELLVGKPIFRGKNNHDQGKLFVEIFGYPSTEQLLEMKVEVRPRLIRKQGRGLRTVLPEIFVEKVVFDLLSSVFRYEPNFRLPCCLVLGHEYFEVLKSQPLPIRENGKPIPFLDYCSSGENLMKITD